MNSGLQDGQAGQHDTLDGAEVVLPEHLRLLPPAEHLRPADGLEDFWHLQELPLVDGEAGGAPVYNLVKGKLPTIREDDRQTAGLQSLQEPEGAQPPPPGHEAEGGVGEKVLVVPPVVLRVVLLAPLVRHLPPVLAVSAGGHHHHVPPAVKVVQRVPGGAPDPVEVALALKCHEVLVLHRKVVGSHKPQGSTPAKDKFVRKKLDHNNLPFWVMFVKEWQ